MAVLPCFLWSGVEGLSGLMSEEELEQGLHAAQAETSLMLKLAPELVLWTLRSNSLPLLDWKIPASECPSSD